ncbi:MAG: V-type ATPase subunit [Planctomycetes bacterium]|nr:V-type ATPase subunit [Planctomycetota bacterium]
MVDNEVLSASDGLISTDIKSVVYRQKNPMYESNQSGSKIERSETWCYISGKVCVLESFLLKRDFFERLINLEKHEDVFLTLSDSPLKEYFVHIERLYESEKILEERYFNGIFEIRKFSPNSILSNIFLIKYDFTNLKNFLKELLAGIPREVSTPHPSLHICEEWVRWGDSEWERLWKGERTGFHPIFEDAIRIIKELKASSPDLLPANPFIIDLALDNAYLCYLAYMVSKLNVPLIKKYFDDYFIIKGTEIIMRAIANRSDMEQISKIFLRGIMQKDFFFKLLKCPYEGWRGALLEVFPSKLVDEIFAGSSKNLFTQFERLTDNYLLRKLQPAKVVTFGPERVFGYLCGLTTETYNLRLTLGGKVNMVNTDLIKESLRELYV